jgi:hypothetical protein
MPSGKRLKAENKLAAFRNENPPGAPTGFFLAAAVVRRVRSIFFAAGHPSSRPGIDCTRSSKS